MAITTRRHLRGDTNLARYLREIRKIPMLTLEQESALARRLRKYNDLEATNMLVTSHLALVAKIAMRYRGYGIPVTDLIAEGSIGMVRAARRFDPERGSRLSSYAMWWIRAEIQQYILHNWSMVKLGTTAAQKKLFFNLRRMKGQLAAIEDGDLSSETVREIADRLRVTEADVIDMNRRLSGQDDSLNVPLADHGGTEWQDYLTDNLDDQETRLADREEFVQRGQLLNRAIGHLETRERHIFHERRLRESPVTLEELSQRYSISRERVRQIELRALEKLQETIERLATIDANRRRSAAAPQCSTGTATGPARSVGVPRVNSIAWKGVQA